jgi:hypothetical protein
MLRFHTVHRQSKGREMCLYLGTGNAYIFPLAICNYSRQLWVESVLIDSQMERTLTRIMSPVHKLPEINSKDSYTD